MSARNPRNRFVALILAALVIALVAAPGAAGQDRPAPSTEPSAPQVAGWVFTPMLIYSESWDNNVLFHNQGDTTTGDFMTVLNPRGSLNYSGRHTQFSGSYDGAFLLYRTLSPLDSYDQHASVSLQEQVTRHLTLFATDTGGITPTTAAIQFYGVPFLRIGSRIDEARSGIQLAVSNRTSLMVAYTAEWVGFDQTAAFGNQFLAGGRSQGLASTFKHRLNSRVALIGDYNIQHGTVHNQFGNFNVQNSTAGVEYLLSDVTAVSVEAGVSRLGVSGFGPARTGPAWRAGLTRQLHKAALELSYNRTFVPAFGFGGTMQNEEGTALIRLPLGRRVTARSSLAWRRNQPLTIGEPKLVSWWLESAIGYGLTPWLRVEGTYNGAKQTVAAPGGTLTFAQYGFQFVLSQPVRIQ